jgi:hypothetical protein
METQSDTILTTDLLVVSQIDQDMGENLSAGKIDLQETTTATAIEEDYDPLCPNNNSTNMSITKSPPISDMISESRIYDPTALPVTSAALPLIPNGGASNIESLLK